jgi:hypothetical protein
LGASHKFPLQQEMGKFVSLSSSLERSLEVPTRPRQANGLSLAQVMKTDKIYRLFKILEAVLKQINILNKPQNLFNADESGFQLINKPGIVAAQKRARDVHVLTPPDRGENVAVIGRSSSEGQFLPPIVILKGVIINLHVRGYTWNETISNRIFYVSNEILTMCNYWYSYRQRQFNTLRRQMN